MHKLLKDNKALRNKFISLMKMKPRSSEAKLLHEPPKFFINSLVEHGYRLIIRILYLSSHGLPFEDRDISVLSNLMNPAYKTDDPLEIDEYNHFKSTVSDGGFKRKEISEMYKQFLLHLSEIEAYLNAPKSSLFSGFADTSSIPLPSIMFLSAMKIALMKYDLSIIKSIEKRTREIDDLRSMLPSSDTFYNSIDINSSFVFEPLFSYGDEISSIVGDMMVDKSLVFILSNSTGMLTQQMLNSIAIAAIAAEKDQIEIEDIIIYFSRFGDFIKFPSSELFHNRTSSATLIEQLILESKKNSLNERQQQLVNSPAPALSIAGPGTGKTTTLISKIIHEAGDGSINQMMVMTFTSKAAGEIKERLERKLGPLGEVGNLGTFHSVFYRVLKRSAYRNWELILPSSDNSLFNGILAKAIGCEFVDLNKEAEHRFNARVGDLKTAVSRAIFECHYSAKDIISSCAADYGEDFAQDVVKKYLKTKKKEAVMNFDDVLRYTLKLFTENHLFQETFKKKFKMIMIDEFQDTNKIQFAIVDKISNSNVVAVGDPYQSIYAFMNARIHNIFDFHSKYKPSLIQLNVNYRSTKNIVKLTNLVTEAFQEKLDQYGIHLEPLKAATDVEGEKIRFISTNIREKTVFELIKKDLAEGYNPSDIAVIVRKNLDSSKLEKLLTRSNISFRKRSGNSFFEQAEIQAILHSFYFWINRRNYGSFRYLSMMFPNIGDETADAIIELSLKKDLDISSQLIRDNEKDLKFKRRKEVIEFLEAIELRTKSVSHSESGLLFAHFSTLFEELGLFDLATAGMKNMKDVEAAEENCVDFMSDLEHLVETNSMEKIEDELSTMLLAKTERDRYVDSINITTAHSAKGLEWEKVYIVDLSAFNFTQCREDMYQLEDEQIRLLYVAVSRAKDELVLIHQSETVAGKLKKRDIVIDGIIKKNPELFNMSIINH